MKYFDWNTLKNDSLKESRGICFENVVYAIEHGFLLDTIEHPNKEKYSNQFIFIVEIDNYSYVVPFVKNDETFFLKTIIPSRKMTKKYLGDIKNESK
ncbi:BrnT family toxin [bacterium]|nr:BrnT family toxin [bacterium]